ncbi:hypothetical protein DVR14_06895 [Natrinema thermotolerans]|nr:hypothetical protein DVR14_06895 [Natrinema thermotolerans]
MELIPVVRRIFTTFRCILFKRLCQLRLYFYSLIFAHIIQFLKEGQWGILFIVWEVEPFIIQ